MSSFFFKNVKIGIEHSIHFFDLLGSAFFANSAKT
jgi:hypothetical protein